MKIGELQFHFAADTAAFHYPDLSRPLGTQSVSLKPIFHVQGSCMCCCENKRGFSSA